MLTGLSGLSGLSSLTFPAQVSSPVQSGGGSSSTITSNDLTYWLDGKSLSINNVNSADLTYWIDGQSLGG